MLPGGRVVTLLVIVIVRIIGVGVVVPASHGGRILSIGGAVFSAVQPLQLISTSEGVVRQLIWSRNLVTTQHDIWIKGEDEKDEMVKLRK